MADQQEQPVIAEPTEPKPVEVPPTTEEPPKTEPVAPETPSQEQPKDQQNDQKEDLKKDPSETSQKGETKQAETPELSSARETFQKAVKKVELANAVLGQIDGIKEGRNECVLYFKDSIDIFLDKFDNDFWKAEYDELVWNYANNNDQMIMFVWCDENKLAFDFFNPPKHKHQAVDTDFCYFMKVPTVEGHYVIDFTNLSGCFVAGKIQNNYLKGLLNQMNNTYIFHFIRDKSWPDNAKKEFMGQLHRFMATLTEQAYAQEGFTELYIPNEYYADVDQAMNDKDLIQRLETTLIHWIRQIKEIVNNQDSQHDQENAGPLDEIAYWRSRKNNLSYIDAQLDKSELLQIKKILSVVDSTYLKGFEELTTKIKAGSVEADDNLLFLKSLYEPCKKLQDCESPKQIPEILPSLLNRVRMIWEKSKFYYTTERIQGLLHKISNEIIKRCKQQINIRDMLDGDVEKCMQDLQDSIECGKKWRKIYEITAGIIAKNNKQNKWDFNLNTIFAQVEAFVQRCIELKEICEGQLQFARKGSDSQIPQFGGSKGPEIINILEEIKVTFRKSIEKIRSSEQDKILDVKASSWHDEFNAFKIGMKDLDIMYQKVINFAFESVMTVKEGVEMLEAFDYLAKRESIKNAVKKKSVEVINYFQQELEQTKYEFDHMKHIKNLVPLNQGKFSGQAVWVRNLIHRIEQMKEQIDRLTFVEEAVKKPALDKYDLYFSTFRQFIIQYRLKEWREENRDMEESHNPMEGKLSKAILVKNDESVTEAKNSLLQSKPGHLESNFDRQLFNLMREVTTWKKLANFGAVVPSYADDITTVHKEPLRVLREYVMLAVRDYNQIIESMEEFEENKNDQLYKKLFKQHLEQTEKVIAPGLNKLKWSSKTILENFVRDVRKSCSELSHKLQIFKTNTMKIYQKCLEISQIPLILIDKKVEYDIKFFMEEQDRHRVLCQAKMIKLLEDIKQILCESYDYFLFQRTDIQRQWFRYVAQIDNKIEDALKKSLKVSLLNLLKTVGDDKTNPIPQFRLSVELESNQLGFRPTTDFLISQIRQTTAAMTEVVKDFPRMDNLMHTERVAKLTEVNLQIEKESKNPVPGRPIKQAIKFDDIYLEDDGKKLPSFYDRISEDHDIKRYTDKILSNLKKTCDGLGELLDPWRKRDNFWLKIDIKEKMTKMMADQNESITHLKSKIENYEIIQSEIHAQKTSDKSGCISLDNTSIKNTLIDIMAIWQNVTLTAIQEKALKDLTGLYQLFQTSAVQLSVPIVDLQQFKKSNDLLKKLMEDKSQLEAKLIPLEEKFKLLDEYNLALKDDEMNKRNMLRQEWNDFCVMLDKAQLTIHKSYNELYLDQSKKLDDFQKESSENKTRFQNDAPFTSTTITNDKAFQLLAQFKEDTKNLRSREEQQKFGVELFKINYIPSADLEYVEREIEQLEQVWLHKEGWDKRWKQFMTYQFRVVNIEEIEDEIEDDFLNPMKEYPKDVKKWEVTMNIKITLEQVKSTLPLIQMLREPYMRERHWEKMQRLLGSIIEPNSETFSIGEVFKLNLIQNAEAVREICEVAREEYKIESSLAKIEQTWESLNIEMEPHKKTYKIRRTDEINSILEEHMTTLASQKTTLFYESFKQVIENWENILTQIMETIEILIQVQRQWIYLESIFASQQNDQDKQLIGDITKFMAVNTRLSFHMQRMYEDRNAKRALIVTDFLQDLYDMSRKLDESQKILFQLLERKRKEFPRFYFIYNDDLFELLGNAKEPQRVNKHVKKCFEGIKKLEFNQVTMPGRGRTQENWEVSAIVAPDGEHLPLFSKVLCEIGVESWLYHVEKAMRETLKRKLMGAHSGIKKKDAQGMKWVDKWVTSWPGQILITACQIFYTTESFNAINQIYNSEKPDKARAWKVARDEKRNFIEMLTSLVRKATSEVDRSKMVALITVMVHSRDIMEQLYKTCVSPNSFDWMKQLRFYFVPQSESYDCYIEHINTNKFPYGFEYQGNNGRLVATGLTDRCYMTLTSAMMLKKGGAPQGPAGTGKTETVKDLGKALAKFVLVFNCSDGLDYKYLGRMFSGLMQTGCWGCFDEFNRIELEVLSVVAQQVHQIYNALKQYNVETCTSFAFEGEVIPIKEQVAIFITMNPGYAGRSELPDNLKSQFRPISMMLPEIANICEIMLQSEGFKFGKQLSIKLKTLFNLMQQQLSKQDHYDFGLRAIKSVLNCAGVIKREKSNDKEKDQAQKELQKEMLPKELEQEEIQQEVKIVMKAIRDMNLPKFVAEDLPLFNALFQDLFPNIDMVESFNQELQDQIEATCKTMNLQINSAQVTKIQQLYDSMNTRHGNMLVGKTLAGKSTCWKVLKSALNTLNKQKKPYPFVRFEVLNPKSITINDLFGAMDLATMEWTDGVLSSMMARLCRDESMDLRWMILDGPVDTLWIESMNTVLDDNKVLTLLNGDRISLPNQVGLLFEVQDLSVASPATVSRAGMIYLDINDLGWESYTNSWIDSYKDELIKENLHDLIQKWIPKVLKSKSSCKELIPISNTAVVISFCKLLDSFQRADPALSFESSKKDDLYLSLLEKWFAFALIWSVGASVNEDGRNIFDYHLRDIESMFPHNNTVYDYYINTEKQEWALWEEKIGAIYKPPASIPFHKMFVPTTDTTRNRYIIQALQKQNINVLICGVTGTGKTVLLNGLLSDLDDSYSTASMVFSAQTSAIRVQEFIESKLVKRTKNKMVPSGKRAMFFIDDLNMPRKDQFGTQSALEILRQWLDYQGWFDNTQKELFKYILDVQLVAAMGPPGGGRAEISQRCQSKFYCLNFTFPNDKQLQRIFQSILAHKFSEFDEEIKPLSEPLAVATINIYRRVSDNFLPIPAKCHYMFNLRDMSKVIQGLYQVNRFYCDSKLNLIRVWVHECLRVFHDRLVDMEDRREMKKIITEQIELVLLTNMKECTNDKEEDTIFIDFFDENAPNVYQEVGYAERDKLKSIVEDKLKEYNEKAKRAQMHIVLFQDAIYYICKIHRIIKLSKGHGLLVGDGGSGRHCLTKLAAFIAEYHIFQVELHKAYKLREFREDIKRWSMQCGMKNQQGVFLFSDNEIVDESFMEDINNILTVGEIPNLFSPKEDLPMIREKVRKDYLNQNKLGKDARVHDDELNEFFYNRVQANFHLMICMSKTGDGLKNYLRMFPGLVNNTTCVWYLPWPGEALVEVADQYLKEIQVAPQKDLEEEEQQHHLDMLLKSLATFCGNTHTYVHTLSQKLRNELQRTYYVTPTIYIDLVTGYQQLLAQKQHELGSEVEKLSQGLQKLDEAAESSETLQKLLGVNQVELSKKSKDCEDLMIKIENDTINANESQKEVEKRTAQLDKEKGEIEALARDAQAEVEKAEPILRAAEDGLNNLQKNKIAELRTYNQPPPAVNAVCSAIMTILNKDTSWASVKKEINDPDFLKKLKAFDKENISQATIKKMEKYTHKSDMSREEVNKISEAAGAMWDWVLAMEAYSKANKDIEPKRKKVASLKEKLRKSEDELMILRENFIKLKETIIKLNDDLVKFKSDMVKYQEETSMMQIKLDRADKLITGLASTRDGWIQRKKDLEQNYEYLVGDALLTAAYLSYSGPFPSEYRDSFLTNMMINVKKLHIPHSRYYKFAEFMVKPTDFLSWSFQGLPDDPFSKDNGVLVTKGRRWPLLIDPQQQGNKWIKNMEREINRQKLLVLDPQTPNYMSQIEKAIATGMAVILQNVEEELDTNIDPILKKSLKKVAGKLMIILGDKEVLYDPNFRFYMTTKIANPTYKPEVSTQVTLVNFIVKERGLEEQLTSEVIRKMENNLEKTRIDLIQKRGQNEAKLKQLDDEILRLLQETKGSLVDDEGLIKTLQLSKETEEDVRSQIENSVTAMKKTLAARENYKNLAKVAAKIFFIVNDFSQLNNMYQMSLDTYIHLFSTNITKHMEKNPGLSDSLQEKLASISEKHKQEVYKYACRGFFEKDKLLLSFQMAVNLSSDIDMDEYQFFLRGGSAGEMKNQPLNPNPDWISQIVWNAICDLEKMPNFVGIIGAFVHNSKEWKRWFMSATPESDSLPGEWEQKCDRMRKMILLKIIRPDRVLFATTSFVSEKIGDFFINPPPVFYDKIYEDSYKTQPIVFILVPGVDPLAQLEALALQKEKRLIPVSLGQGQVQKAKEKIFEASRNGSWLYLTNCHLSLSFLKELEKILEQLETDRNSVQENFRLFMSTNPHPKFPISVLQNSLRVTTEPPKGLKANMSRLYNNMPDDKFNNVKFQSEKTKYKKLVFALSWFHSIIIERNKFKSLGWNLKYDFNDSDWITSDQILLMCLDTSTDKTQDGNRSVQWDMIKYIISEVLYGGRVTDDMDRRLLNVYANQYFNDKVISEEKYILSDPALPYVIPDEVPSKDQKQLDKSGANPAFYEAKIREFPQVERPEAFGQHINAEISSQIADTNNLIDSIISLQPRTGVSGGESRDSRVLRQIKELIGQLPHNIDMEEVVLKINPSDQNPLKVVLLQEIARHNILLDVVFHSLTNLEKGIHGIVLISEDLEIIYENLYLNKVPGSWSFCYYSLKTLHSWMNDLERRVQQLNDWAFKGQPNVFWISGFSFPTGFTTALQQQSSRKLNISIDQFSWEFLFLTADQANSQTSKDGAYINGLNLEGAGWDYYKNYLIDAEPMKLHYEMPIIHMKPVISEGKVKQKKGQALYQCPTYMYPIRTGVREKPSFMFIVNLPCKPVNTQQGLVVDTDFYVKRGTALLMSLAD